MCDAPGPVVGDASPLREHHHVVEERPERGARLVQGADHGHVAVHGDAAQHVEHLR